MPSITVKFIEPQNVVIRLYPVLQIPINLITGRKLSAATFNTDWNFIFPVKNCRG